jgi:hypothetical protein
MQKQHGTFGKWLKSKADSVQVPHRGQRGSYGT